MLTAEILTANMLFNSVVSTRKAQFVTIDISNFLLNTPMAQPEYIRIKLNSIPIKIIKEYNLEGKATDGSVYVEVNKKMYGLPQEANLPANQCHEK